MTILSIIFLRKELIKYSRIVIPESSNNIMINTCKILDLNYTVVKKNNVNYIIDEINKTSIQKHQKQLIINKLQKMNNIKVNYFNEKQRRVVARFLFKKIEINDNDILFDDSKFTGITSKNIGLNGVYLFKF
jgi:hypothetical protein